MKIVIIGGVAGGASAAARLRRLDENAEIVILERGDYVSFANCGLPYYIGGEIAEKSASATPDNEPWFKAARTSPSSKSGSSQRTASICMDCPMQNRQ